MKHLLSLDQGTTGSRAVVYDETLRPLASARREVTPHFPRSGWVEQDALAIWDSVVSTARDAIAQSGVAKFSALGITNQRETIVLWDRRTGMPLAPAIVWQDRRTADALTALHGDGREPLIRQKTGLLLDPYFSASKLQWLLGTLPGARARAEAGELAAGTIDSWLIFKLTDGRCHVTDITNASRTMLMHLATGAWDPELLALFDIPPALLPRIVPSSGTLGETTAFGKPIPICGVAGDQQSALFGQLCHAPGQVKCTYGTGCFMLASTGASPVVSRNRLLTTVAWKLGDAPTQYALEGSVFVGGAAIQWLRDGLKIIRSAPEVNALAAEVSDSGGVVLVPAFTGLGAPYWDSSARGTLLGLTRGTTAAHLARATLDGIAWQVTDLLAAMKKDFGHRIRALRVDGGASASNLLMQLQADSLGIPVERPQDVETTALGAALLAGLGAGLWKNPADLAGISSIERVFLPTLPAKDRKARLRQWHKAVKRAKNWADTKGPP